MTIIKRRAAIIFLVILGVSLFLRVHDLGKESIWYDEAVAVKDANLAAFSDVIKVVKETDNNPPFYFIFLHFWIKVFGNSEFSVRMPSVIFSLGAIFMIYKVGGLLFGRNKGIVSSLLLGLSPFHIYYSQEARMYSLASFLTLVSFYFFLKILDKWSYKYALGYIIANSLFMYTHSYSLLIILSQNIYFVLLFISKKRQLSFKNWLVLQTALILLFAPWINVLINKISVLQQGFWVPRPSILSIIHIFQTYAGSGELLAIFLLLCLLTISKSKKTRKKILFLPLRFISTMKGPHDCDKIYLLLIWILTPIVLPFIISQFSTPIIFAKYTIGASLAFYLLAARGITIINSKCIKIFIMAIIISFSILNLIKYHSKIVKENWRTAVNYVENVAEPSDFLLFAKDYIETPYNYYSKGRGPHDSAYLFKGDPLINKEELLSKYSELTKNYNRVWIIISHCPECSKLIKSAVLKKSVLKYKKYRAIEVYLVDYGPI